MDNAELLCCYHNQSKGAKPLASQPGRLPHTLRHTYTATRMQTLDHGAPVSPYTVMRELGHRDLKLIEDTYGHLQARRDRVPVVQYRETKVVDLYARRGAR